MPITHSYENSYKFPRSSTLLLKVETIEIVNFHLFWDWETVEKLWTNGGDCMCAIKSGINAAYHNRLANAERVIALSCKSCNAIFAFDLSDWRFVSDKHRKQNRFARINNVI